MVAFMAGKSGPTIDEYGKLIEYQLPADASVQGPGQVGDFINQNPQISAEFTLLGQAGSKVIQGNMLVIPIEESLLYVQPIYITADDTGGVDSRGIPELKRVVVSFNQQIEIGDTLDEALFLIFGESSEDGEPAPPPSGGTDGEVAEEVATLLAQASDAFEAAERALQDGNLVEWATQLERAREAVEAATALITGAEDGTEA